MTVQLTPGVPVDALGYRTMVPGVAGSTPWPRLLYNAPIRPPAPGELLEIAGFTVTRELRSSGAALYVVRLRGALLAMGSGWVGLCHYRGWQLDPKIALERPRSWPVERMNAWQRLQWYAVVRALDKGELVDGLLDTIAWTHPNCGVPPPVPRPMVEADTSLEARNDTVASAWRGTAPVVSSVLHDTAPVSVAVSHAAVSDTMPSESSDVGQHAVPRGHPDGAGQFSLWKDPG